MTRFCGKYKYFGKILSGLAEYRVYQPSDKSELTVLHFSDFDVKSSPTMSAICSSRSLKLTTKSSGSGSYQSRIFLKTVQGYLPPLPSLACHLPCSVLLRDRILPWCYTVIPSGMLERMANSPRRSVLDRGDTVMCCVASIEMRGGFLDIGSMTTVTLNPSVGVIRYSCTLGS